MKLPLIVRIFLVLFLLVLMAVAAAVWVTVWQGRKIGESQVLKDLSNIDAARKRFDDQVFERLQLRTNLISSDPDVAQYLNVSTTDNLGLDSEAADELGLGGDPVSSAPVPTTTGSVADLLKERKEQYGFDLGIILDPEGGVLARTDQPEAFEQYLTEDPLLAGVIADLAPAAAYWRNDGVLYQATAAPIVLDEQAVGFLLLADEVDEAAAQALSDVSGAKVSFWTLDEKKVLKLGASSLDRDQRNQLSTYLTEQAGGMMASLEALKDIDRLELNLAGERWLGNIDPLVGGDEKPLGAVLTLARAEQSKAAITEMQKWVIGTGLGTLLLALGASWFLARGLLNPVRKLAKAARQAADGDYSLHIEDESTDEIGQLSHAFDQLLSSLREKNDMEGYVAELSRLQPDSAAELSASPINRTVPPTRIRALLIALDFKRFAHDVPAGQEGIFLTQLASLAMDAEALARHRGGRLLEAAGPVVILAFEGENRTVAGFNVLANLLPRIAATTGGAAPSAAALEGEVVFGSLPNREPLTATLGTAATQARRLLAEAPPGQILLSPQLAKILSTMLGKDTGVGTGMMSGKKFYALLPTDLTRLPALPEPEGMADANATRATGQPTTPNGAFAGRDTPNQTRLAPGMRLGGRFEILGVLGVGGMGMVYKARDIELDDLVALKMLKPGAQIDASQLDRLKSELKLARKITHPNVLRTYDFGELQGNSFISMEFVRGMTLRYLLTQSGRLPYSAALRLARQVTAGLQAAHEVGVLHRDIKPENVILTPQGNAKLMDFGIARPLRKGEIQSGEEGMFVGTPNYASPEALSGDEVDARADIYSMGIMLTEMFCGRLPFEGGDTMEIYLQHLQKPPIRPGEMWPEIPRALEVLILKCLEKKPAARYGSAADLLTALSLLRA